MAYEEDTSKQQSEQEKPVVRRDKGGGHQSHGTGDLHKSKAPPTNAA